MKFLRVLTILTLVSILVSACGGAAPQAPQKGLALAAEGTPLRKIQDRGKLIAGVKYDVPLFGYLNPTTNQLEGFDVEMAKAIAGYIFGDPTKVEFKEAISKNRIPFLKDGVVDVVISTMTINADREKEIDFSVVYYLAGQSLLVPKASAITSVGDLGTKKVGTVKGSTSEKNIRASAPQADVQLFDTYSEAVAAMEAGRVEAVTTDDIILLGFVSKEPDKWKLVGGLFTFEPYGIGVAKGSPELLNAVNKVIKDMKANGQWKELFKKVIPGTTVPEPPVDNWRDIVK